MVKTIFLLIACWSLQTVKAQKGPDPATDSVCQLVRKFINQKEGLKVYQLTSPGFRTAIEESDFLSLCNNNLFPLGLMGEITYESIKDGVSHYKAKFATATLALNISLDRAQQIEYFLFAPYQEPKKQLAASDNTLQSSLDRLVDSVARPYIQMMAAAGLSIGILKEGKFYYYNYGEQVKGSGKIPTEASIYEIGSITKTFTATLLAMAAGEGKISLSDPLNRYLPAAGQPADSSASDITLLSLANHSSGLPRMPGNFRMDNINNPYLKYDSNLLFQFYQHFKPTRKAGDRYDYSNLGVGTLGVVLERTYHTSYEELVIKRICLPLHMKDTRQHLLPGDSSRFTQGYDEKGKPQPHWDFSALAGAGCLRSTAADLLQYARGQLGAAKGELLKAINLTHQPTYSKEIKVGLAWHLIRPGNDEILFHNGGTGGFRSYLGINMSKKIAVVILSNCALSVDEPGNGLMKKLE